MTRSPDLPCVSCGVLMWRTSASLPAGEAKCRECRGHAAWGTSPHGSSSRYDAGCRCDDCREAARVRNADWRERRRADGRPWRYADATRGSVKPSVRQAVYKRDSWMCQICSHPIDRHGDPNGLWAASVDHVQPRSKTLAPDHTAGGLRAAHRLCNSLRADARRTDAEVREIVERRRALVAT